MSSTAPRRMTVDEFLVWAEGQEGRWELYRGVPYLMSPEQVGHAEVKFAVQAALLRGIRQAGLSCHMLLHGATVRVSDKTCRLPWAVILCLGSAIMTAA
ncbi:MAG: hypothetical protein NW223_04580 [Hyphomicrobiaceae bacterium]|nr:hypothetical protein [Hyphomicrobiaceae bacterium]